MVALDTNVLVYAHRKEADFHEKSFEIVANLAESKTTWIIPSHALVEFYSVVTHPKIYKTPSTPVEAREQLELWLSSPSLLLANSTKKSQAHLFEIANEGKIRGPKIHDMRIAVDAYWAGATKLWSADRELSKVKFIKTENPLL